MYAEQFEKRIFHKCSQKAYVIEDSRILRLKSGFYYMTTSMYLNIMKISMKQAASSSLLFVKY